MPMLWQCWARGCYYISCYVLHITVTNILVIASAVLKLGAFIGSGGHLGNDLYINKACQHPLHVADSHQQQNFFCSALPPWSLILQDTQKKGFLSSSPSCWPYASTEDARFRKNVRASKTFQSLSTTTSRCHQHCSRMIAQFSLDLFTTLTGLAFHAEAFLRLNVVGHTHSIYINISWLVLCNKILQWRQSTWNYVRLLSLFWYSLACRELLNFGSMQPPSQCPDVIVS